MSKIVIALGGNALGNNPDEQQKAIKTAVKNIVDLIKAGHEVVLAHGNGPQVGVINLAFEDSYENENIPYMPFPECTAMSQGYIGYHLQKGLRDALEKEGITKDVITIVTQVVVDKNDPSFKNPTKPVGPFYKKKVAEKLMAQTGEQYVEDSGRGWRKVVASPKPVRIVEINAIKQLVDTGNIVIAAGGGGIPIYLQDENKGASAVIDKDLASALMAQNINADILVILTAVEKVYINFNKENQVGLDNVNIAQLEKYMEEEQFAKGSMLPKINACINFVQGSNKKAIITSLDKALDALNGVSGTTIMN